MADDFGTKFANTPQERAAAASAKAVSTIGTILKFGEAAASLSQLCKIKGYPALGGEPEQIETTDLEDKQQTYVPGVQSMDSMQFTANYTKESYAAVKAKEGTPGYYQLEFGDAGKDGIFSWQGQHFVFVNEGEVNGVREMTITVSPSSEIKNEAAASS